jgi:HEPN domain-containing protein
MGNRVYAVEWLQFASRSLLTANHLFEVNHCTNIIVIDAQQAIEKTLKSLIAYENRKITTTHNLDELASLITDQILFNDYEIKLLEKITDYYREDRYPNPNYTLPSQEETKEILDFAQKLFDDVCKKLNIDKNEILNS